jgi:RimJ/RimL family protein N-acetyltransferase
MASLDTTHAAIRTERLVLRPLRASDAQPLVALFADWEVIRRLSMPPWPYDLADAESFIREHSGQDLTKTTFAITRDDALIGGIDVRMNDAGRSQRGPGPNLGYWLGGPYWGQGYMTEAARGFLAHVFDAKLGDEIYSGAFADNTASLRVQEKLGFVRDGETMLYARPRQSEFLHVNTVLKRAAFEASMPGANHAA